MYVDKKYEEVKECIDMLSRLDSKQFDQIVYKFKPYIHKSLIRQDLLDKHWELFSERYKDYDKKEISETLYSKILEDPNNDSILCLDKYLKYIEE